MQKQPDSIWGTAAQRQGGIEHLAMRGLERESSERAFG